MTSIQTILDYYHSELKKSQIAKDYLKSRGITKETIIKFKLGYAPSNSIYVSRFHDRLIIPIHDPYGNPVGWTARTLIDSSPKYVNTKESPEFQKSRLLFGYHLAKKTIFKSKCAILVEGQFDALRLHQEGLINTVASSGTSFKATGANLLARYANKVYIAFDGDNAGENAKIKAQKLLQDLGVKVVLVNFPEGEDPDTYVYKYGIEFFKSLLRNSNDK